VTISVVSIGVDANPELRQIAELGGGRFYRVRALAEVPDIFLSETIIVAGRDIAEGQFTPATAFSSSIVRGLGSLPPLYGYNVTEPRDTARTILVSPDSKPVLAQWQYGLGRSIAWTSDMKGQWAQDWVTWAEFPRFVGGMLDALLPPEQAEGLALETRTEGAQTIIDLLVEDASGRPDSVADIQGRLLTPNDESTELTFSQVGAGRYRAVAATDESGVYLAQVAVLDDDGQLVGNLTSGIAISYSPEYRPNQGAGASGEPAPLLAELAAFTEGQQTPPPEEVFTPPTQPVGIVQEVALPLVWLALLLWPLDIATRRLLLRRGDVSFLGAALHHRLRRSRPAEAAPGEATVARLKMARARANPPRHQKRSTPAQPAQPSSPSTPPESSEQPPKPVSSQQQTAPQPKPQPSKPAPSSDEALASLLAAKQRARRNRQNEQEEG
jgi:hypothetical protein